MENHQWKGNETWKNKESVFNEKKVRIQAQAEFERRKMEEEHQQTVKIFLNRNKLWKMDYFSSFTVVVNLPLSREEILERMQRAFPKLVISREER